MTTPKPAQSEAVDVLAEAIGDVPIWDWRNDPKEQYAITILAASPALRSALEGNERLRAAEALLWRMVEETRKSDLGTFSAIRNEAIRFLGNATPATPPEPGLSEGMRAALVAMRGGNHFCPVHKRFEVLPRGNGYHATPEEWDRLTSEGSD